MPFIFAAMKIDGCNGKYNFNAGRHVSIKLKSRLLARSGFEIKHHLIHLCFLSSFNDLVFIDRL